MFIKFSVGARDQSPNSTPRHGDHSNTSLTQNNSCKKQNSKTIKREANHRTNVQKFVLKLNYLGRRRWA